MLFELQGREGKRLRIYLEDWAGTHHKHRPVSDWVAGLSSWGKELQVYGCTLYLPECLKAWNVLEEPFAAFIPNVEVHWTGQIEILLDLARRWFCLSERSNAEMAARSLFETMQPVLEPLAFYLDEYSSGPGLSHWELEKGLKCLEVSLHFCSVLSWSVENEATQFSIIDELERQARAEAGPVMESVLCIQKQMSALAIGPVEAKKSLIEHLQKIID